MDNFLTKLKKNSFSSPKFKIEESYILCQVKENRKDKPLTDRINEMENELFFINSTIDECCDRDLLNTMKLRKNHNNLQKIKNSMKERTVDFNLKILRDPKFLEKLKNLKISSKNSKKINENKKGLTYSVYKKTFENSISKEKNERKEQRIIKLTKDFPNNKANEESRLESRELRKLVLDSSINYNSITTNSNYFVQPEKQKNLFPNLQKNKTLSIFHTFSKAFRNKTAYNNNTSSSFKNLSSFYQKLESNGSILSQALDNNNSTIRTNKTLNSTKSKPNKLNTQSTLATTCFSRTKFLNKEIEKLENKSKSPLKTINNIDTKFNKVICSTSRTNQTTNRNIITRDILDKTQFIFNTGKREDNKIKKNFKESKLKMKDKLKQSFVNYKEDLKTFGKLKKNKEEKGFFVMGKFGVDNKAKHMYVSNHNDIIRKGDVLDKLNSDFAYSNKELLRKVYGITKPNNEDAEKKEKEKEINQIKQLRKLFKNINTTRTKLAKYLTVNASI